MEAGRFWGEDMKVNELKVYDESARVCGVRRGCEVVGMR